MSAKRNKGGFTLVEIVIAMAIAILVSFSAVSVVLLANSISMRSAQKHSAVNQISCITECFYAADNTTEFEAALDFCYESEVYDFPDGTLPAVLPIPKQYYVAVQTMPTTDTYEDTYSFCYDKNGDIIVLNAASDGEISAAIGDVSTYSGGTTIDYIIEIVVSGDINAGNRVMSDMTARAYKTDTDNSPVYPAGIGETMSFRKAGEQGVS